MSNQKNRKNPVGSTISDGLRKRNIAARAAINMARFLSGIVEGAYVATIGRSKVKAQGRRS